MKISCEEKDGLITRHWKKMQQWHVWFAWHPVRINSKELVWLENVERKGTEYTDCDGCGEWSFEYRRQGE